VIREAVEADIPRIVEMGSRSIMEGPYREQLDDKPEVTQALARNVVTMPNAKVLVCEQDGKVCGLLAFIVFPHYFSGEITAGELIWYVEPEARAGGDAIRLLGEAEKLAKSLGAKRFQMTAPTKEIGALYARCGGYKEIETTYQRTI
jgi:GNAT superfamily N-acetyltransferase